MFIDEPSHGSILSLSQTSSILQKIPALFWTSGVVLVLKEPPANNKPTIL